MSHMSCGCGKRQDEALAGTTLRQSRAVENASTGLYDVSSFPDCDVAYHGAFAKSNVTVYVVDINGPNEQFFLKSQRNDAAKIARTQKLTLAHLHPANLCHDAMIGLFGA